MKRIIILLFGLILSVCAYSQKGFKIKGEVEGFSDGKIFFVDDKMCEKRDTLARGTIKDGKFSIEGKIDKLTAVVVRIENVYNGPSMFLENTDYEMDIVVTQMGERNFLGNELECKIEGGKAQEISNLYWDGVRKIVNETIDLKQYYKIDEEWFEKYSYSYVASYILAENMDDIYEGDMIAQRYSLLGSNARNTFYGKKVVARIDELSKLKVGLVAPDFKLTSTNGDKVSLHNTDAKVKLLYFWTPGCGPCIQSIPKLVKLHKKYHNKGLEWFSIVMLCDKQKAEQFVDRFSMKWNTLFEAEGDSSINALYHIACWPTMIIIDGNNKILSTKSMTVDDLEKKLNQLLN